MSLVSGDGTCDSCDRYVGSESDCPYCGDANQGTGTKLFRWAAVLFAVIGLCVLWLMPRWSQTPFIKANEITPLMSFGRVQMEGKITKEPYVGKRNGLIDYLSFSLNDGSGVVRVVAYDDEAKLLAGNMDMLQTGSCVHVLGTLTVKAGRDPRLTLRNAGGVERVASGE